MIEEENVKGNVVTDHSEFFSIALLHTDYPDFPIFLKKLSRFPVEIFLILPIFMLIAPLNPSLYFILSPMLYVYNVYRNVMSIEMYSENTIVLNK